MRNLVIIGAGGHGKVCANIAEDIGKWDQIFFLDDNFPEKNKCLTYDVIGKTSDLKKEKSADYFVAIGNNLVRKNKIEILEKMKFNIVSLIHPTAYISEFSTIGKGTSIHQHAVVNTHSTISKGCIINTSSIVEHESFIGKFVHLSPNVTLGGNVKIGENSWIGMGTTIINNIIIEKNIVIGAQSLVLKNVCDSGVFFGAPLSYKKYGEF